MENSPLTPKDLDKNPGWKPANPPVPACTSGDFVQLESNLKNAKAWADMSKGLSQSCQDCVITDDTDQAGGPLVTQTQTVKGSKEGFFNYGACFGYKEGATCGRAVQYYQFCLDAACGTCASSSEHVKCTEAAASPGGMCKSFADDVISSCPKIATTAKFCNNIIDAAKTLCSGAFTDAGLGDGG